jgi:hypothetical protein
MSHSQHDMTCSDSRAMESGLAGSDAGERRVPPTENIPTVTNFCVAASFPLQPDADLRYAGEKEQTNV